ncbi:MAG: Dyp-type peroxidase [Lewinella sp.]|uniref:Dyp-type peroxidase n=1 Tax=Lewinella sp. TaxID=2004506 RepID=UPI003D6A2011
MKKSKPDSITPDRVQAVYKLAQPGLLYMPAHGIFLTIQLNRAGKNSEKAILQLVKIITQRAESMATTSRIVAGFSSKLWKKWTGKVPPGAPGSSTILKQTDYFKDTQSDLFFYLKSEARENCEQLKEMVLAGLDDYISDIAATTGEMSSDRKILDRHYYDGITSPSDPAQVVGSIIRADDNAYAGSSWAFVQKFNVDWQYFARLNTDAKDEVIGRNGDAVIIPDDDKRSHIQRARVYNNQRENIKLVRQALPFGKSKTGAGREKGIYFVAYANDTDAMEQIMHSMAGHGHGAAPDNLLNNVQGIAGGYYYLPNTKELELKQGLDKKDFSTDPHWATRSKNGWMFYNSNDYLTVMGTDRYPDPPSQRILHLIGNIFSLWRDHWYQVRNIPEMQHLSHYLDKGEKWVMKAPIPIRKGMAIKKSLSLVNTNPHYPQTPEMYAWQADQFRIDPQDILFGIMPELSLGRGKEVMPYLRDDEKQFAFSLMLDESSAMGHIVPDHKKMLKMGLGALIADITAREEKAKGETKTFYTSSRLALEGVQSWLSNYSNLATQMAKDLKDRPNEQQNLLGIAKRANKLMTQPPETFLEATQLVFTMHACFHLTGNPVAVGRLDQLLIDFYKNDNISEESAQEIIEAFWIKLGEKALHNRHYATDHVSYGTTAVSYIGGNFPQGGGINQWVQQLTVGGSLPTSGKKPKPGANAITMMALKASRRLPLNAPCLSLRIYKGMDKALLEEAAKAILSGGAHPILFQEERMIKGLHEFSGLPLEAARDFASDGCYEPMVAGQTEFCFSNVTPLDAVECALNQGAKYSMSGPIYLRGWKSSFRSPHASEIKSFAEFQTIFLKHLEWFIVQFFNNTLMNYGNLWKICPSPMLSTLIEGCVESGRDLTNGGAKYHIIAPMFVGMATTIDSLYAIKKLVFDDTAVCTLPELLDCLSNDWGYGMQEPSHSTLEGKTRIAVQAKQYEQWRAIALQLPKFGNGHAEVDEIGTWLSGKMCDMAMRVLQQPPSPLKETLANIKQNYSTKGKPWEIHLCPGIGTFEGYVGDGAGSGASADGRRNGQPYPSDFSPAPVPQDLSPIPQHQEQAQPIPGTYRGIYTALSSWDSPEIYHKISNASPVDLNIKEDFPLPDMVRFIKDYSEGKVGSNLLTVTCVDPDTYQMAAQEPERFELVRVRMGGWTEYFAAMFPEHQGQHERRPYFVPENRK